MVAFGEKCDNFLYDTENAKYHKPHIFHVPCLDYLHENNEKKNQKYQKLFKTGKSHCSLIKKEKEEGLLLSEIHFTMKHDLIKRKSTLKKSLEGQLPLEDISKKCAVCSQDERNDKRKHDYKQKQ